MHVLVTGVSGFIGNHLCTELLKKGITVTGIYRTKEKLPSQLHRNELKLIQCDVTKFDEIKIIFENNNFDGVFHLAGETFRKDNPGAQLYFQNNFLSTLNLLECCRIYNTKKFIFSSSIAIYGLSIGQNIPNYLPVDENHELKPFDFYDLSKYFSENLCKYYSEKFNIVSVVLRYSRVFGPGLKKGFFFIASKNALSNKPIDINGDISTDFVFINDVVNANILSFKKSTEFNIFNIGSGQEITLAEIAKEIIKIVNSKSTINFKSEPKSRFSLDISKARKILGYSPTPIKQGLKEVISHVQKQTNDK